MSTTYWRGDLARYTGNTSTAHGVLWYEIEMLEGHLKGQKKVTRDPPK
ncbi:MAG: hypothetical protein IPL86_16070 [Flavobacteriales bacterium]|nr:hypothetical protein [Flavobacteriales bacterium]